MLTPHYWARQGMLNVLQRGMGWKACGSPPWCCWDSIVFFVIGRGASSLNKYRLDGCHVTRRAHRQERIDFNWSEWFEGMTSAHRPGRDILSGAVADQRRCMDCLRSCANLGLSLVVGEQRRGESISPETSQQ